MKQIFHKYEKVICIDTNVNDFHVKATQTLKLGGVYQVDHMGDELDLDIISVYLIDFKGYNKECEQFGFDSMRFKSVDIRNERLSKLKQIESRG